MKKIYTGFVQNKFNIAAIFLAICNLPAHAADPLGFSLTITSPVNTPDAVVDIALEQICPDISDSNESQLSNLIAVCDFVAISAPAQIEAVTKELSAKVNTSANTFTAKTPSISQTRDIGLRLSALRNSTRQVSTNSFRSNYRKKSGPKLIFNEQASSENGGLLSQRLSGFLSINNVSSQQLETQTEIGYESNSKGLLVGLDYRIKSSTFVGVASQYFKTNADLTDEGSQLEASQLGFTLYGTHLLNDQWYIEALLNNGQQQLDITRHIELNLANVISTTAIGNTNSRQLGVYLGTGYEIPLQYGFNSLVSISASYVSTSIAAYTEDNAGNLGLEIDSQDLTSLTSSLNTYLSKTFSTPYGVLIPQLSATWIHETETEKQKIAARFINDDSNRKFIFYTPPPDSDYFIVGLDLQMILPQGRMAFIKYSNVRRLRDKTEYAVSVGFRMEL